jgi:hypothetical protein
MQTQASLAKLAGSAPDAQLPSFAAPPPAPPAMEVPRAPSPQTGTAVDAKLAETEPRTIDVSAEADAADADADNADMSIDSDASGSGSDSAVRSPTRWARRKNGMKLSLALERRVAKRPRPSRSKPVAPSRPSLSKPTTPPPPEPAAMPPPPPLSQATAPPPTTAPQQQPWTAPPFGPAGVVQLLQLFQEHVDARMENLQRMELMLRSLDPLLSSV